MTAVAVDRLQPVDRYILTALLLTLLLIRNRWAALAH